MSANTNKSIMKKLLQLNATNLLRELQCDQCPDKTQIYNTSNKTCVNRSSKEAMRFVADMTFCDKYFSEKLNQEDNTILNKILNIRLYENSQGKIIKLRDYIPKEIIIPKTKRSATLVLIAIVVLIIGFLPQRLREKIIEGLKFVVKTNTYHPQYNFMLDAIIFLIKNLTIMSFLYSFAGFTSHFFYKIGEIITGKKVIIPNKNHVPNEISGDDKQNEIHGVDIKGDTILDILQQYKMVKDNNTTVFLSKLGLNTIKSIVTTNVPKAEFYYKGNSKIYFKLYGIEFVIFEPHAKGKMVFINYSPYELKKEKITPLLHALDKLKERFITEQDKIHKKILKISEKVKSLEKKLSLENKKGSKKNSLTIKQHQDELDAENEMTTEKMYLYKVRENYNKFLKSKGLLYQARKRLEHVDLTNWRSDTIFMEEWIKQQNGHLNRDYYENIAPEDLDILLIYKKELAPKIEIKMEQSQVSKVPDVPSNKRTNFTSINNIKNVNVSIGEGGSTGNINIEAQSFNAQRTDSTQIEQQEPKLQRQIIDRNRQKTLQDTPKTPSQFKQTEGYHKLKKTFKEQTKMGSDDFDNALLSQDPKRLDELIFQDGIFMLPNKPNKK